MNRLAHAWKQHRLLLIAFALAVAVTFAMGGKVLFSWIYWSANHKQAVAGWMTPGYVAHSWKVDRRALVEQLVEPLHLTPGKRETIAEIAERTGLPEAEVIARIEAAVAKLEQGDP